MLPRNKPDKLVWTERETDAFESLKKALLVKPVLRPPDPKRPFKIFCDANRVAIASILAQEDDNGCDYVVAYASRKLLPREQNYSTIEAELLAIVYSIQKYRQWIFGREISVFTDHRALVWLNSITKHSSRLARWTVMLQDYNIKTTYIKGQKQ